MKRIFIFVILFLTLFSNAQNTRSNFFDKNLDEQYEKLVTIAQTDPAKGLEAANVFINQARKNKNPYYEVDGMSMIDYYHVNANNYTFLLKSSERTLVKARALHYYIREIDASNRKSWALMHLGLLPEAKKILDETALILDKVAMKEDLQRIIIGNYWSTYQEYYNILENDPEAIKKANKALSVYQKIIKNELRNGHLIDSYSNIGSNYLFQQKVDSAFYYFTQSKNLIPYTKVFDKKNEAVLAAGFGMGYNIKKEYKRAIPYLIQSLDISKKNGYDDIYIETLRQLSISFKESNKINNPYYQKYIIAQNEYYQKNKLKSEEIDDIKTQNSTFLERNKMAIISLGSALVALFVFVTFFLSKKKKNIEQKHQEVTEIVKVQSEKITELNVKINDAFEEVLELARNNDPSFLRRFSDIYDKVYNSLVEKYPELSDTQLKILALSYLNFTTKDIAASTNTSPRTVQTHKYNIRKIIEILPDEDFIKWVRNFENRL